MKQEKEQNLSSEEKIKSQEISELKFVNTLPPVPLISEEEPEKFKITEATDHDQELPSSPSNPKMMDENKSIELSSDSTVQPVTTAPRHQRFGSQIVENESLIMQDPLVAIVNRNDNTSTEYSVSSSQSSLSHAVTPLKSSSSPESMSGTIKIPLISSQSLEAAYADAQIWQQKAQVIVGAIEHFYPQIDQTLQGASFRFAQVNPKQEIQRWIQRLDNLYHENFPAQQGLVTIAQSCWLKLEISSQETMRKGKNNLSRDTTEEKLSPISRESPEESMSSLLDEHSETQTTPSTTPSQQTSVAVKEREKWHQRQLALEASTDTLTSETTPSHCCIIL